ncbi:aminoglycoside adenylyltransferase [Bacillus thuringiensis]|uniref:Aminoglycoside adenylyltransferase n=1 Tax=Bacillus thuringiensis TaxID=1428 RepID=A0AB36TQA5_BACTU|nr:MULTISPECIES: aminoglycoside 6-adenylyltransferase [Bacillus cereus group]PEW14978.1 aminoglycoside adenylyltransferase [Bacillus cereus]PFM87478.1 aminoglycoside adenylyltransferase [Bacillus thuringiensis]PFN89319.1 aminoglycoside adenylyltransferase [Bacillus thuringiensis]
MRSEKEMFDLIIGTAKKDERIRAVYMNGSRTNPNAPKDIFQDYDIVYVVTEIASFIKDKTWIHTFGDLLMIQEPDKNNESAGMDMDFDRSYGYLMLFTDGNRIDLHIETKDTMIEGYMNDKLTVSLLDKDNILPLIPAPTDIGYHVKRPTASMVMSCCNDFWWCLQNVAKGIWRDELPYAKQMFEYVIRGRLDQMVSWWIGIKHEFQVSTGKMGKYFKSYLPESYWEMYEKTYSDNNYENFWDSIFVTCELFRTLAEDVADNLLFTYPIDDDVNMTKYLKHVRNLPSDAKEIL